MNKEKRLFHLFYGLAPILIYYGVTMIVVTMGEQFHWTTDILNFANGVLSLVVLYFFCYREYNKRGGSRAIPPLFPLELVDFYRNKRSEDGKMVSLEQKLQKAVFWKMPIKGYVWILVLGACGGIALNNWFSIMGLFEKITTYNEVRDSIYYGSLWMIFARTAILAPLVEEILVRGLFYRGLSNVIGRIPGMVISALFFAIMHGNLLQGMYAFILGMLFAYVYDMSGRNIWAPILAHASANVISVLGTSVPAVSGFFYEYFYILTGLTTILMVIAVMEIYSCRKQPLRIMEE